MSTILSAQPGTPGLIIEDPRRRRGILLAVCIALMAVIASVTGLNVAQPQIALAFDASQSQVLWMINIYAITLAALLLPLGAAGDRWGRKPMLLLGLVIFGVANATAGLASSFEMMLVARFLSGAGAAMIMPVTLAVITATFPDEERVKAIGVWTAVAGGGGLLGMLLSAILVDTVNWCALLILPLVLVLIAGVMTVRSVPSSREDAEHPFDVVGALTSVIAIIGLSFALHEGPEQGWMASTTLLSLLIGIAGAIGFLGWERRHQAPLLDLTLFRDRGLTSGSIFILVGFGVQAGIIVVLFPYFQAVLGWSGLRATLALMPMAMLMMAASALGPRVAPQLAPRVTMAAGIFLGGVGLALMAALVSVDGGYRALLPGMVVMGLGMGLAMTPATAAITSALPRERQGVASALNDVTRELGTALGVAFLGAIFAAGYRSAIDTRLTGSPDATAETARKGMANALAAVDGVGPDVPALIRAAQESFVAGWQQAMWVGVGAMALLLAVILVRGPQHRAINDAAAAAVPPRVGPVDGGSPQIEGKACS